MSHKTIDVGYVARVEGEGSIHLEVSDGHLKKVQVRIFEPPRFFESLLKGRPIADAPDMTARVCGICPVAYQMSAVHAAEALAGVQVGETIAALRRLLYCGEWIESHTIHLFFLHMPDFLGYHNLIEMARSDRTFVEQALSIKKVGNALIRVLGGRETHPINIKLGGFYQAPQRTALEALVPDLKKAFRLMEGIAERCAGFSYPEVERPYHFLSLRGNREYPMCRGSIVSSKGLHIGTEEFEDAIEEFQVRGSHALYARLRHGGSYLCGPLARIALNFDLLPFFLRDFARRLGIEGGTRNPFRSLLVRALEILFALDEAMKIIQTLPSEMEPSVPVPLAKGSARAVTEAPRGLLYHRYDIDESSVIEKARLIPPTSQNQLVMEEDLLALLAKHMYESEHFIQILAEKLIRNHDPCISCAAHFLRVTGLPHRSFDAFS